MAEPIKNLKPADILGPTDPRWIEVPEKTLEVFRKSIENAGHRDLIVSSRAIKYPKTAEGLNKLAIGHKDMISAFIDHELQDPSISEGRLATVYKPFPDSGNGYVFFAYRSKFPEQMLKAASNAILNANKAIELVGGTQIPVPNFK